MAILSIPGQVIHYQRPAELKPQITYLKGTVTKYGWTGNPMANGEYPHEGAVASSDRSIPLGTKVLIDGKEYTVKDRTAKWVHEQRGFTIDIYSEETNQEMLNFGRKEAKIAILQP